QCYGLCARAPTQRRRVGAQTRVERARARRRALHARRIRALANGALPRGLAHARGRRLRMPPRVSVVVPLYNKARQVRRALDSIAAQTFRDFEHPPGSSRAPMWIARGITEGARRFDADTPPTLFVQALAYMSPCTTAARVEVVKRWGGFYAADRCLYGEDAFLWMKVLLNE